MQTVDAILNQVYGGKPEAAAALGGARSGPWNWSKSGHFPAAVALKIARDAKDRGVEIPLEEIPVLGNREAAE